MKHGNRVVDAKSDELIERVFEELYTPTFSVFQNEYQPPDFYRHHLKTDDDNPKAHMLVCDPDNPSGFLIFELYEKSMCALVTYIAIKPSERGKGISRLLFNEAFRIFKEKGVKASYAEVHNPSAIDPQKDIMNPDDRLKIFKRLGGEILPIKYAQPPLEKGLEFSKDFFLLTFHMESGLENMRSFLHEFYQLLEIDNPDEDENFLSMF